MRFIFHPLAHFSGVSRFSFTKEFFNAGEVAGYFWPFWGKPDMKNKCRNHVDRDSDDDIMMTITNENVDSALNAN